MVAKWLDLSREQYQGIIEADDTTPFAFNSKTTAKYRYANPADGADVRYIKATGKKLVIDQNPGKIVRAYDMVVEVNASTDVFLAQSTGLTSPPLAMSSYPDVIAYAIGMPALGIFAWGFPPFWRQGVAQASPYQGVGGLPQQTAGWTWSRPTQNGNVNPPLGRPAMWEQKGVLSYNIGDSTRPVNLLGTSQTDTDYWAGGYGIVYPGYNRVAFSVEFTRLRVLVDDKPTWSGTVPSRVGLGNVGQNPLRMVLAYPSGEFVVGQELTVRTTGDRLMFGLTPTSSFGPSINVSTDESGAIAVYVKGVGLGEGTVIIEVAGNPLRGLLFAPPLSGSATIDVYGTGAPPTSPDPPDLPEIPDEQVPPDDTPDDTPSTDPGSGCVTYPEIEAAPSRPPTRLETNNLGWNAGANSIQELDGNVRVAFDIGHVVGVALGFVGGRGHVEDYKRLTHAFFFTQNDNGEAIYRVMELGVARTAAAAYVPNTTQFEIRRAQGAVSYWVDGTVVYRSRSASSGTILVGTSMYSTGDSV